MLNRECLAVSDGLAVLRRSERRSSSDRDICFDARGRGRDGLILDAERDASLLWSGVFAFVDFGCDAVTFVGSSSHLLVVARGEGYLLDVVSPLKWSTVPAWNIRDVIRASSIGAAVACDATTVFVIWAIDRVGTRRLDADGIYDLAIHGDRVTGNYERDSQGGPIEHFDFELVEKEFPLVIS